MTITLVDKVWTKSNISIPHAPEIKVTLRQLIADLVRESIGETSMMQGSLARRLLGDREQNSEQKWLSSDNPILKLKIESALTAVRSGKIFAFVDDRQIDDLDAPLTISPGISIEFFAITPVQGG